MSVEKVVVVSEEWWRSAAVGGREKEGKWREKEEEEWRLVKEKGEVKEERRAGE